MIQTLTDIIKFGAEAAPQHIAFRCGSKEETYNSLFLKMSQLSNRLNTLGVKKGDRVGIFMHRSIDSAIAVYGILNAGAAFVPIDPSAPLARIRFILNDCNISVLISSAVQKKILSELSGKDTPLHTIIGLNSSDQIALQTIPWQDVFQTESRLDEVNISEDDLAYIMFTSGSTGIPKGIMHTHKSGLNYARLSSELYNLSENDVVGNVAPLFFDQSTFGYFSAPFAKASTILVTDGHLAMLGSFSNLIEKEKVTILYSVPLIFIQLLEANLLKNYESLKWILYGGEPFPPKKLNEIIRLLPHVKISNIYGPAEVNQCTYKHIFEAVDENKSVPLGKKWSETWVKIIDDLDQEVKPGKAGELLVSSSTMMKGYWNNELLNEKAFYVESDAPNRKYYRTGDMVRNDHKDELLFVGRKDRQAKVRGYRVELEEIENSICSMDGIKDAAAYIIEINDEKSLCAAVTFHNKQDKCGPEELRKHLQQFVPKYSIPGHFIAMADLPRTKNGKVDYSMLEKQFHQINQLS